MAANKIPVLRANLHLLALQYRLVDPRIKNDEMVRRKIHIRESLWALKKKIFLDYFLVFSEDIVSSEVSRGIAYRKAISVP